VEPGPAALALRRAVEQLPAPVPERPGGAPATVGRPVRPGPATPAGRRSTRLPEPRNRLIGRDRDLDTLDELVRTQRIVTITGPGGAGKSTLALAVARRYLASAAGDTDVVLAELAPVRDRAGVVRAVAEAAGVQGEGAVETARLAASLGPRPVLLVLDNCEHLLDPSAVLVDAVLDAGAGAHVLVTSREPLRVDGEVVHRIGSLGPVAAELFVERAAAVAGPAAASVDDPRVVELCRRLDGLPLAIELAAAQLQHLSLTELVDRIDDLLTLLVGGRPRAGERHSALAATIAWSYDLLSEPSRRLFDRLGVFPAGFDLPTVEALVDDGAPGTVTNLLGDLVGKNLVVHDPGSRRYRLLETIRLFAAQRLAGSGLRPEVTERLRRHVVARSRTTSRADAWLSTALAARSRDDVENVRLAFDASLRSGDLTGAVDVALGLCTLWRNSVFYAEGRRWVERLREHDLLPADRMWTAILAADVGLGAGDARLMNAAAIEATALRAQVDDPGAAVLAEVYASMLMLITPAAAVPRLERARDRARAAGAPGLERVARAYLVVARRLLGEAEGLAAEADVLIEAGAARDYDRYICIWAGWLAAVAERDGPRMRELMDVQLSDLAATGLNENWVTMFSNALTMIGERADYVPQLLRARRRAEAEGRSADADTVLALAYAAAVDDAWEEAAELLGAVRGALFHDTAGFVHHTLLRDQVVRPRLDPAAFDAACERGERRDLSAVLTGLAG
jgi:predicted ATPase